MLLYICVCLKIDCSDQKLDLFATSSFPISPTSEHSQKTENVLHKDGYIFNDAFRMCFDDIEH